MDSSFMEEGSPTMVEKGMDPSSMFEMCDDDDDNGIHDVKETSGAETGAAPLPSASFSGPSVRQRKRGRSQERSEPKTKQDSWMDPPEEKESTTLTQAEIESCMQTYGVRQT